MRARLARLLMLRRTDRRVTYTAEHATYSKQHTTEYAKRVAWATHLSSVHSWLDCTGGRKFPAGDFGPQSDEPDEYRVMVRNEPTILKTVLQHLSMSGAVAHN